MIERRVLFSDNGTISDYSPQMNDYHSGTMSFDIVAAEDAIFIGSLLPFNHLYLKFDGANVNSAASNLTVQYWDGNGFQNAVDIIDETKVGLATFAQSGFVTWSSNKNYSWVREDTNYGGNTIDGLTSVDIYDHFWLKLTFSGDLDAGVTFSWLGQKFSDDYDLGSEHKQLLRSGFITAFESGKTDWEEQHIKAAELISEDLINLGVIADKNQILRKDDFKTASVKKVAEIIFGSMGRDYYDDRDTAKDEYERRINKAIPLIDINVNGRFDHNERRGVGRLVR